MIKKELIFLIFGFLLLGIFFVNNVKGQGVNEISVEADIPNYFPNAEELRHPTEFFSGEFLKIKGEFSSDSLVSVVLNNKTGNIKRVLEILKRQAGSIKIRIPIDIPTDYYELSIIIDGNTYNEIIKINGLSLKGSGGEVVEEKLSAAIMYYSKLGCKPTLGAPCYWESSLAGNPRNPDSLALAPNTGQFINSQIKSSLIRVSNDGGRSWINGQIETENFIYCCSDPKVLIAPDGTLFTTQLMQLPNPNNQNPVYAGALFQGSVTDSLFKSTLFAPVPSWILEKDNLVVDFPKIAYDSDRRIIYITGNSVRFPDDPCTTGCWTNTQALFMSKDGGKSFSVKKLVYEKGVQPGVNGLITDIDVRNDGALRTISSSYFGDIKSSFLLARFDKDAQSYTVVRNILPIRSAGAFNIARVLKEDSKRLWVVWSGPEMVIDKSSRHPNRIYIAWAQPELINNRIGENFDIFLSHSDNDGDAWSVPLKVNDDETKEDQVFPSMNIDSDGIVHIAFLDKRETPDTENYGGYEVGLYDVYYAKIVEDRISRNIRVNPIHISNPGGREPGDYFDMVVGYPSKAYVTYPCEFNKYVGSILTPWPTDLCLSAIDLNLVPFPGEFHRGDSTQDFVLDISDAINILGYLFTGSGTITCQDAADVNDDGDIDLSDALYLLDYLFKNERQPPSPFPEFGKDLTEDNLDC